MKWQKLGKLFDPNAHPAFADYLGFAQSPQALVFDDFVRIYFSIRKQSENGKYVSHIQYIDMDKEFTSIINTSRHEVISVGALGCYDEHGIFPINVLRYGSKIYAYLSGWSRRVSVSVETGIGLAYSIDDGCTFQRAGPGPVMTSSLFEPYLVVDGFVRHYDGIFHMWYIYGTDWIKIRPDAEAERTYKIGSAVSEDGINWEKEGRQIICDKIGNECQALPTVIEAEGLYHMIFAYRSTFDFRTDSAHAYRLGYAYSEDLIHWTRDDGKLGLELSEEGWDSEMVTYPHLFQCDDNVYLLYNGNAFGRYGFGLAKLVAI